jgi:hypothetical protein
MQTYPYSIVIHHPYVCQFKGYVRYKATRLQLKLQAISKAKSIKLFSPGDIVKVFFLYMPYSFKLLFFF